MPNVKRSVLRETLLRSVAEERVHDIMTILEPLFCMCAQHRFLYGYKTDLPSDIPQDIARLTQRPCDRLEWIAVSTLPARLLTHLQSSNFSSRTKRYVYTRLDADVKPNVENFLSFDLRNCFGPRLIGVLPTNLWSQVWDTIFYWLLCEMAGRKFRQEAQSLEKIVRLIAGGYIVFDFKPTEPTVALVVNAQSSPNQRFRLR